MNLARVVLVAFLLVREESNLDDGTYSNHFRFLKCPLRILGHPWHRPVQQVTEKLIASKCRRELAPKTWEVPKCSPAGAAMYGTRAGLESQKRGPMPLRVHMHTKIRVMCADLR